MAAAGTLIWLLVVTTPFAAAYSLSESGARAYCADKGWVVNTNYVRGGALICTPAGGSPSALCDSCSAWQLVVWISGAQDSLYNNGELYNTRAGHAYGGHVACTRGWNLQYCGEWASDGTVATWLVILIFAAVVVVLILISACLGRACYRCCCKPSTQVAPMPVGDGVPQLPPPNQPHMGQQPPAGAVPPTAAGYGGPPPRVPEVPLPQGPQRVREAPDGPPPVVYVQQSAEGHLVVVLHPLQQPGEGLPPPAHL